MCEPYNLTNLEKRMEIETNHSDQMNKNLDALSIEDTVMAMTTTTSKHAKNSFASDKGKAIDKGIKGWSMITMGLLMLTSRHDEGNCDIAREDVKEHVCAIKQGP